MMPDGSYSVDRLLEFLKHAGMEGLINPAVARARRKAVEQLAAELTEEERADLRKLDVDELASRFHKLEGSSIRSEALSLYAERVRMAQADFLAWNENPAGFQSVGGERRRAIPRGSLSPEREMAERITLESTENPSNIVPIALREDETVYVANLPLDLTAQEAERIARVVRAFARDDDEIPPDAES
ncbi:hypothetical protein [Wenzhouxiangella sp. EGI_FJ10305]|uniref:hypothetical protein n=1 Tax=Wenzhouxiangella sp. EGI_FJ10305 TaxID=3243768 RepID=UPI0035DC383D